MKPDDELGLVGFFLYPIGVYIDGKTKGGGQMESVKTVKKTSLFRTIFGMMINPSGAVKSAVEGTSWYFSLLLSGMAFSLFFVQTGLDLYKTGQKSMSFVFMSAGAGFVYGIVVIPLIGVIAWGILKLFKSEKSLKWAVTSYCLSYSGAFVYGLMGIAFSLFMAWRTAMAFGVTGVLWAVGPLMATSREMTKGNTKVSILIATLYSGLILISWAYFGNL